MKLLRVISFDGIRKTPDYSWNKRTHTLSTAVGAFMVYLSLSISHSHSPSASLPPLILILLLPPFPHSFSFSFCLPSPTHSHSPSASHPSPNLSPTLLPFSPLSISRPSLSRSLPTSFLSLPTFPSFSLSPSPYLSLFLSISLYFPPGYFMVLNL